MRRLITAAAVLALAVGAVQVQAQGPGDGRSNDKRGGGGGAAASMQASNSGRSNTQSDGKRGEGNERGPMVPSQERGAQGNSDNRGASEQRSGQNSAERAKGQDNRGQGQGSQSQGAGAVRGNDRSSIVVDRGNGRGTGREAIRVRTIGSLASLGPRGLIAGCPPGLAQKRNGCQPPGQSRNAWPLRYDRPDWWGLAGLGPGDYFYRDGYLLRLLDGGVASYIPLLGGALAIGNPWPSYYEPVILPDYYADYYDLGPYNSYRYYDDVLYRVDPETAAITSIAALLTGDDFVVGRPMPVGYDVYNVPWGHRKRYYDRPDAWYRYSDGYIYQIDPETRLVAAAIELIAT